ncbi:type II secretion system protein N [Methylomarinum sp. Ch1-1]|uniref:Type II secretion system protein N n=1 Tax=Methylomarinum roseum TaxID=3067653 RepID=A0AAU7NVG3_9GAMM|nr:type II secretion system protein N [Methylomarinum sp. Ch1-1]MDP4522964.1 hypothetical protein [Methylomarinum sp. Ch1-1]
MSHNLIKLLLSLCLLLLVILLLEWLFIGSPDYSQPLDSQNGKADGLEVNLPAIKFSAASPDSYTDMVERPLFIEGRRPVIEDEEDDASQQVDKIEDLVLVGIYTVESEMTALFSKQGRDETYLKKSRGDDISGWLLQEIQADRVILEREGKRQTLMLRKPKPESASKRMPRTPRPKQ